MKFVKNFILLLFLFISKTYAKGSPAYIIITNRFQISASNYFITNKQINSNIIIAEIRGIFELSSNTNIQYGIIGNTNKFWYSVTNRGNIIETNLYLKLTNFVTNSSAEAGNWIIGILDKNSSVIWWTNSYNFSSYLYKVTNKIPMDSEYKFSVFLKPATNTSPIAWASVDIIAFLQPATNISYYTAGGNYYGGLTNIKRTSRVEMSAPFITLIKEIEKLTNVITGGYQVMPGCEIWYRIFFTNKGTSPGTNFQIIDILPKNYVMLTNYFVYSNFGTNLSPAKFSANNGISFDYNFSGWSTNVTHIKFSSKQRINPGISGIIKYRIKIK